MIDAPLALAFAAGLVATINPCGFAMLPAYLGYFVGSGSEEQESSAGTMQRALYVGGVVSLGFIVVFGVIGSLIAWGATGLRSTIVDAIPWVALVVGALVAILGMAMLFGHELTVRLPKAKRAGKGTGFSGLLAFGISYAIASLSCTLPVFLSVVALQVQRTNFVSGLATFIVYGTGMSMLLVGLTIAIGLGRVGLIARLRASARRINQIAGGILVVSGSYIVWFWATNIGSGATALGESGAFRFVETLSQRAFDLIGSHPLAWGLGLGATITAAVAYVVLRHRYDLATDTALAANMPSDANEPADRLVDAGHDI